MSFSQYQRNDLVDIVMLFYNLLNVWGVELFLFDFVSLKPDNILARYYHLALKVNLSFLVTQSILNHISPRGLQ